MNEYWALHNQLIQKLRAIGIWHSFKDRLELAFYRHHIAKVTDDPASVRELIDKLIILRREGKEPAHKDGRYL